MVPCGGFVGRALSAATAVGVADETVAEDSKRLVV